MVEAVGLASKLPLQGVTMERIENPELDRLALDHLANLYKIKDKREGIHLSTLVYCLTRSFFDQLAPVEPTDEEVMLFALGYGLQDVLTPTGAGKLVCIKDGITYSPDFLLKLNGSLGEIKTTRMSSKTLEDHLPETWIEYIMGGCYIREETSYNLMVLLMMGNYHPPFPKIHSETLVFEEQELQANWDYLLGRKEVYEEALSSNQPPQPFQWCKDWECKFCKYRLQCQAMEMVAKKEV